MVTVPPCALAPEPLTVADEPFMLMDVALSALQSAFVSFSSYFTRSSSFRLANCTFAVLPVPVVVEFTSMEDSFASFVEPASVVVLHPDASRADRSRNAAALTL
ncbi:hypothetical protein D3C73_1221210 [compost metagenome]